MSIFEGLKNHPFDVDARFDFSLVLTYAFPIATLQPLLPDILELDTFEDRWAFMAIAMVQTRGLRPSRLPGIFGRDFFLIGTRIFVRCPLASGQRLRGLYIVRSQSDTGAMRVLGDVFTRYRYETIPITVTRTGSDIDVRAGDFHVDVDGSDGRDDAAVDLGDGEEGPAQSTSLLPAGSPFSSWKDARRFAGPMPHTFSTLSDPDEVLVVEGVRRQWRPRAVHVREHHVPFFAERGLSEAVLASAFIVEDVPYHWKAGRRERCRPRASDAPSRAS
jgi:hypothetical protein